MPSTASITKVGLLASTTILQRLSLYPPNEKPAIDAVSFMGFLCTHTFIQSAIILFPDSFSRWGDFLNPPALQNVSGLFLAGAGLIFAGSFLRLYCYRTLGEFFSFQVELVPGHRLVKHGPYAIVRHPSYTGLVVIVLGFIMVNLTEGSLLYQMCGSGLAKVAYALVAGLGIAAGKRAQAEDGILKAEFGKEWEDWARAVRWKLFPGIF